MHTPYLRLIRSSLFFLDLVFLNASVLLAAVVTNAITGHLAMAYIVLWAWLNAGWMLISWIGNLYTEKYILSFETHSRRTMHIYFYWLVLVLLYVYFMHQFMLSRKFLALALACHGVLLVFNRFLLLFLRSYFKHHRFLTRKIIIIGYNSVAKKLASYLEEDGMNAQIVGYCEEEENVHELSNYPIIGSVYNSIAVCRQYHVDEIYTTIAPEHNAGIYRLIKDADQACINFRIIPDMSHFVNRTVYINYLKDMPVLSLRQEPLSDPGNRIRKRLFDIFFSLAVIVLVLSWLIPLLGFIIWLESPGSVFFKQQRTGRNRKTFNCFKLRSMKVNADADNKQATKDDIRLTRIGSFMRKRNLDEFPQFFNVLIGDMSIVGPRPHMLKHTYDYSMLTDKFMIRQFLKPGITGWAQVKGYRGEITNFDQLSERVDHDIWYMENWGLWLDVRIVFITLIQMITGEKHAY